MMPRLNGLGKGDSGQPDQAGPSSGRVRSHRNSATMQPDVCDEGQGQSRSIAVIVAAAVRVCLRAMRRRWSHEMMFGGLENEMVFLTCN